MATIIPLPARHTGHSASAEAGTATILFFTGVRYMHDADDTSDHRTEPSVPAAAMLMLDDATASTVASGIN